jgi:hypothetical protein
VTLIPNWRDVLRWAWSVRLMALAAVLSGVEIALPLFAESFPRLVFAGLSFLATVAAFVARFVAQKEVTR